MDTNYRVIVTKFSNEVDTYDLYELKTAKDIMSMWMLKSNGILLAETKNGKITKALCAISNTTYHGEV